jgi:hypothetical protein
MSDALAVRPHDPRVTRWGMLALALVAGGSFFTGMAKQLAQSPSAGAETGAPAAIVAADTPPPAPVVTPSMQVATVEPPAPRPRPAQTREEAPELLTPPPVVTLEPAPDVAPPAADAASTAPAEDPVPPPEPQPGVDSDPPTD